MFIRRRLSSHDLTRLNRDDPKSFSFPVIGNVAFVEMRILLRSPVMALPRISSAMPREYTLAVSNIVTPASTHRFTMRVESFTSVLHHALKNSVPPPNVPVPKLNTGTRSPEFPSCLYSIYLFFSL